MARETIDQKQLAGYGQSVRKPVYVKATPQQAAAAAKAQEKATKNGTFRSR